jgi:antigen flippase
MIAPIEIETAPSSSVMKEAATINVRSAGNLTVFRTIVAIGAVQVLTMLFTLMRSKVVAITAGPAGVGAISIVDQVVVLVAQISTFSLPYASIKMLSAAHSESRESFARGFAAFLRLLLVISVLGAAVGIALVFVRPSLLGTELLSYRSIVIVALIAIPATNLSALVTNALAAARRVRASALLGLVAAIALAAASISGILLAGLYGYYVGNVIAVVALAIGGMIYLARAEGIRSPKGRVNPLKEVLRYPETLSFAGALYVVSFTTPLAYLVARYALVRTGGFESAGLLQAAMGLALALRTIMRSSNALFLTPTMNRLGESERKFQNAVDFSRGFALTIGIIALPMVLFPDWGLRALYSSRFTTAAPFVFVFVLSESIQLLAGVNQALLVGLNYIGTHVTICVLADLSVAAISWWLVPHYGIGGVALALLFSPILIFLLTALRLRISHQVTIYKRIGWLPLYVIAVIGIAGAAVSWSGSNTVVAILVKMSVWTVFALSLLRTFTKGETNFGKSLRQLISLRST